MAPKCSFITLTALLTALSLTLPNAFAANTKKKHKKQQAGTAAVVSDSRSLRGF